MTLAPEEKDDFHRHLNKAREIWAREEAVSSNDAPSKAPESGGDKQLWKDTFVFNVSFNVVYTNNTVEGGYEP